MAYLDQDETVKGKVSLEEYIQRLKLVGVKWQKPPPMPEEPIADAVPSTSPLVIRCGVAGPRVTKAPAGDNHDSESESETIGRNCTTDLTGETVQQCNMARRGARKQTTTVPAGAAAKLDREAFKDLGLETGEKASNHEALVPWNFLVLYGELYVGKANRSKVEPYFEREHVLANQDWDVYYLYDPADLKADPLLFVPTCQLEAYLRKINKKLRIALKVPDGGNEAKFFRQFNWLSTPRPRYLGRTNGVGAIQMMKTAIPLPEPEDDLAKATEAERDQFTALLKSIKRSCVGGKGDAKASKARQKAASRYESRKAWGRTTKRVQRYLGLRDKVPSVVSHAVYTGQEERPNLPILNDNAPAPFDTEDDVVFICFDIETYERTPMLVTEVGFAILDTKDLRGIAPGRGAENWFKLIKGRHLRVKEYRHLRNGLYVEGWPDHFQFGNSEMVGIGNMEEVCNSILSPKSPSGEPRKVVIVGHDVKQDITLLHAIDVDLYDLPGLLEIVDNQRMQQHNSKYRDPQRLSMVLNALDISHCYLHNGGNDAVYTLQSMLALAVLKRQASLAREPKPKNQAPGPEREFGDPLVDAGWSTGGEDTDGSRAPLLIDPNASVKFQGV